MCILVLGVGLAGVCAPFGVEGGTGVRVCEMIGDRDSWRRGGGGTVLIRRRPPAAPTMSSSSTHRWWSPTTKWYNVIVMFIILYTSVVVTYVLTSRYTLLHVYIPLQHMSNGTVLK